MTRAGGGRYRFPAPDIRTGHAPVIEPKHGFDDPSKLGGNTHRTGSSTIIAGRMLILRKLGAERFAHRRDWSREQDAAPVGVGFEHSQPVQAGEGRDFFQIGRIGPVNAVELIGAQISPGVRELSSLVFDWLLRSKLPDIAS